VAPGLPRWEGLLEVISASKEEMKVEPERHPVLLTEVGLNGYVSVMNWVCLKIGGTLISGIFIGEQMIRQWIFKGQPIFRQSPFPQLLDIIFCE
jgi:hypothetical protein